LKTNKGFTLVELMICVGIIGILAGVVTPIYSSFKAKTRKAEAKLLLGAIYNIEEVWYNEYETYSSCLNTMGHHAPREHYYSHGFTNHAQNRADQVAVSAGAPSSCNQDTTEGSYFFQGTKAVDYANAPTREQVEAIKGASEVIGSGQGYRSTAFGFVGNPLFSKKQFSSPFLNEAIAQGSSNTGLEIEKIVSGMTMEVIRVNGMSVKTIYESTNTEGSCLTMFEGRSCDSSLDDICLLIINKMKRGDNCSDLDT
jgi:prepilin-type N-terminal cleavage/methylation domain-containing protein